LTALDELLFLSPLDVIVNATLYVCSDHAFNGGPAVLAHSIHVFHLFPSLQALPSLIEFALLNTSRGIRKSETLIQIPKRHIAKLGPRPPQTRAPSFKRLYPK